MNPIRNLVISILLLFPGWVFAGGGQPWHAVRYNIRSGMASNEVNVMMQDARGFIWLGTSNGLSRFDGYEFMHFRSNYKTPDFLTSNTICDIKEDAQNRLWLATAKGVSVFDPRTQSVLKIPVVEEGNGRVNTIEIYDENTVFFGCVQGLYVYDVPSGTCEEYLRDGDGNETSFSAIRAFYLDQDSVLWIGHWRRGVEALDWKNNRLLDISALGIPDGIHVNRIKKDHRGNIYIATWGDGLIRVENGGFAPPRRTILQHPTSDVHHLDRNIIYDLSFDDEGRVWLGTPIGLRLVEPDADGFREVAVPEGVDGFNLRELRYILRDRDGNMWVSDFGNGVVSAGRRDTAISEIDLRRDGLNFSIITGVYQVSASELWLGVMGVGMVRYDLEARSVIRSRSAPVDEINRESNAIVKFAAAPRTDKVFLAARYYGVYELTVDDGRIDRIRHIPLHEVPNRNEFTNTVAADSAGNIWVGMRNGIALLRRDPQSGNYVRHQPRKINELIGRAWIDCLTAASDGRIWAGGTETGLYSFRYDPDTKTISDQRHYTVESGGINNNKLQVVYEDSRKRLWAGTYGGGLTRYDPQEDRFRIIDNMRFFASDVICSITEDLRGNLWLATGNGIICYNPESGSISNYGTGNGFNNVSFLKEAALNNGKQIFFGGYDGLSVFEPDALRETSGSVTPSIVDIQLFNESVNQTDPAKRRAMIDFMPPFTGKIRLSHRDYSVSIRFAAPSYHNAQMNKYTYKMEGIDKEWNYAPSSQRTITYTKLKPGDYTFLVKASDERGAWNESPAALQITVLPPPWATAWAFLVYALLAAGAAYVAYRIVRNRIRLRQALEIEQIERLKSEEVNNAKLTFFTNVSHELFTPITIISTSLEKLVEVDARNEPLLRIMKSNLNRLMRLLQQVLEFRKADSANLRLRVSENDVTRFIRRMCDENFAPLINNKNIHLIFTAAREPLMGYIDTDKLDKIMYNLLSNAFKYNRQDGKVFVHVDEAVEEGMRYAVVTVRDTGKGIAPEQLPMLFTRFYEGDYRRFDTRGTGIGLSLTRDLVTLHHGTIEVSSHVGEGTQFLVRLPVGREAFDEEQIDRHEPDPGQYLAPDETVLASDAASDDGKHTLLLVEDNEELLLVMRNVLSARYRILTARNGHEALEVLSQSEVDLVITDYVMPGMDGVELTTAIKENIESSHLPVIMLSARSAVDSKLNSFHAGVDAYISKPFEVKLLVAQVDGTIANRRRLARGFREAKEISTDAIINTSVDKRFMDKTIALIEANIADPGFDINAFNHAMTMSNSTLYRKIKSITGMSPKEFIRNIRFKTACRLLLEKSTNISDVAYMVGFTDARYFSLCFKKEYGMTPREYINRNKPVDRKSSYN